MKNNAITILMILLFATLSYAQNQNYDALWEKVEQFEQEGLPKSALDIVNQISEKATQDQNTNQMIKSLLFKSKYALVLEEDAQLKIINDFKSDIANSDFPKKNILENLLAHLYWQYFQQNRWQFYNRTQTDKKVDPIDFRTWNLQTLFNEISLHFEASLQNGLMLQKTSLEEFDELLIPAENSKLYRPTLFDFLTHNALTFYKTDENSITQPAYKFEIDNPAYLGDAKTFSEFNIQSKDSSSLQLKALKLYQDLIQFHLKDDTPIALTDVDIERLKFIKQHATFSNKETVYKESLKQSIEASKTNETSGLYQYELAQLYYNQGLQYHPTSKADHQWQIKEAMTLVESVIAKFPNTRAEKLCSHLKVQILQPRLTIQNEQYIPSNKVSKLLVNYKNIDALDFSLYALSKKQLKRFNKLYRKDEQLAFIQKLKAYKTWKQNLIDKGDYQNHSIEVPVSSLNNGHYLIFANTETAEAFTTIQVTNFALIEKTGTKQHTYQIIDRNNGTPITNASVKVSYQKNYRESFSTLTRTTDVNGEFVLEKPNKSYTNIHIEINKNSEIAYFGNYYLNQRYKDNDTSDQVTHNSFLFTDRSIYRPGQTVYFKGILMETFKNKSQVTPNQNVFVALHDANGQMVSELDFETNEFGAFNGEFVLPNIGLTGQFYIRTYSAGLVDNHSYFSVEEYKRPKFETKFKPITESFKVNDSITITGEALAFAGTNITDAKVVYRVHRKVQYPRWFYWYRPQFRSEPQEIAHGETKTNVSGEFSINFKALPDTSIDTTNLPVFNYEITADVTDINGETRSATTVVHVGYHSLLATIAIANRLDKTDKSQELHIDTKNLNGEFIAAKGNIKIYKLEAPENTLRKRPWQAPDYKLQTETAFKAMFPHEAYNNEDDPKHWQKGTLVFDKSFDTKASKTLKLGNIKRWTSGQYLITLESKDAFGQTVKDETRINVYSNKDKTLADHQLFSITTNKPEYQPGETAIITLGSTANINVFIEIEKDHNIIKKELVQLNNSKQELRIPVTKDDVGGFVIHYGFAAFNSVKTSTIAVNVPYPKTDLEIETTTFRDKLQPGTDETWSFKIKGSKGDKVSAELLASMYDASLDQFKSHSWNFNPIQRPSYYSNYRKNAYKSFGIDDFKIYNTYKNKSTVAYKSYDALNWFGLHLNESGRLRNYFRRNANLESIAKIENRNSIEQGKIKGIVYDQYGMPLPGVNIIIKGSTDGTQSDFDGLFELDGVQSNTIISFTYVGYKTLNVTIDSGNYLKIILAEDLAVLSEVVVTAQGIKREKKALGYAVSVVQSEELDSNDYANQPQADVSSILAGKVAGVQANLEGVFLGNSENIIIRSKNSLSNDANPLYVIDGIITPFSQAINIAPNSILSTSILKGQEAITLYGEDAADGVIIIITKKAFNFDQVKIRKNLQETAFFYPNLKTDKDGNVSFSFTTPEALTQWKLQLLAHTKTLESAAKTLEAVTQKELMVVPNAPRFLREGDQITISSKISNLSNTNLSGQAKLELTNALTGEDITSQLVSSSVVENFSVDIQGNTNVSWSLTIPDDVQAVQYKVLATTGAYSDGEQNVLPVLSNRLLVTESMPMWIRSNQTKTFTLDKLKNTNSSTLKHHNLTLEMTSNPAWYAVQALPYLMEYPYDCNEQTFSKYYANALASHIVNSNPRIKTVFEQWKSQDALISNLEKNQELKNILIQETPWLRDAQSETEQQKRIALLFDLNKMNNELQSALNKLKQNQHSNGAWAWFNGGRNNRYITQHIIAGFGHLSKLNVTSSAVETTMIESAINYLDKAFVQEYKDLKKYDEDVDLSKDHLSYTQLHYLYMRSFFQEIKASKQVKEIQDYYLSQIKTYWLKRSLYSKGLMVLVTHRFDDAKTANKILKSLEETSITSEELGMYWKENTASWYWYQAPIETQALMIETFAEVGSVIQSEAKNLNTIDNLKIWLLKNKQTNRWKTTKATTEAVYALLLQGSDWLSVTDMVDITLGNTKIKPSKLESAKVEAGTGYFKTSWKDKAIQPEMANVTITKKGEGIAWGGLYWQYFEDLDKIYAHEDGHLKKTSLSLNKKLFLKTNTDTGEQISEITKTTKLKIGDLVRVRIELRSDRAMEFVHMKDMRASGLEPVNVLSQYKWQDGLGYYESTKDAATNFFFDYFPKGVYVFEYDLRVNNAGIMSNGITTIQSMYAPEFSSHSEGTKILIKD